METKMENPTETQMAQMVEWLTSLDQNTPLEMRKLIAVEVQRQIESFTGNLLYHSDPAHFRKLEEIQRDVVLAIVKAIDPYLPPVLHEA